MILPSFKFGILIRFFQRHVFLFSLIPVLSGLLVLLFFFIHSVIVFPVQNRISQTEKRIQITQKHITRMQTANAKDAYFNLIQSHPTLLAQLNGHEDPAYIIYNEVTQNPFTDITIEDVSVSGGYGFHTRHRKLVTDLLIKFEGQDQVKAMNLPKKKPRSDFILDLYNFSVVNFTIKTDSLKQLGEFLFYLPQLSIPILHTNMRLSSPDEDEPFELTMNLSVICINTSYVKELLLDLSSNQ
ncbi:MAG: hypothetical protein CL521_05705 [Actinobacteria bacterium]|nr:hypothetical protein [Actinomycetota bacterium]